jgi:hypothetical protein
MVDVLDCARRRYDRKRPMLALGSASQRLPGGLFLFCNLCWRFTRQLIPRFLVVRVLVDPVADSDDCGQVTATNSSLLP